MDELVVDTHAHVTLVEAYPDLAALDADCRAQGLAWVLDAGIHPSDFEARAKALGPGSGLKTNFHLGVALAPHEVREDRGAVPSAPAPGGCADQRRPGGPGAGRRARQGDAHEVKEDRGAVPSAPFQAELDTVEGILRSGRAKALSEIGLDYSQPGAHGLQREVFSAQLALAKQYRAPVFLHIRDAWDDALNLVRASGVTRGAVHCFTGSLEQARAFMDLGFMVSFSGIVSFKNARDLHEVAKAIPLSHLLTETDAPWLAPAPQRGKPNRPAWVRLVNQAVAALRSIEESEVHRAVRSNAQRLLGI